MRDLPLSHALPTVRSSAKSIPTGAGTKLAPLKLWAKWTTFLYKLSLLTEPRGRKKAIFESLGYASLNTNHQNPGVLRSLKTQIQSRTFQCQSMWSLSTPNLPEPYCLIQKPEVLQTEISSIFKLILRRQWRQQMVAWFFWCEGASESASMHLLSSLLSQRLRSSRPREVQLNSFIRWLL